MTIQLIGLNHGYQLRGFDSADWSAFEQYLLAYTASEDIDLIAEELSNEAIRKWKATDSVARHVAQRLGVRHLFCDPESGQRRALGIRSLDEIAAELEPLGQVGLAEAKKREAWLMRERFWLERLREVPFRACVFILGSQHVESFALLLRSEGWEAAVVEKKWKP